MYINLKTLLWFSIVSFLMFGGLPVTAQTCQQGQWEGTFYNTTDFSGPSVHTECASVINFNWAGTAPAPAVNFDNFSSRWTSIQSFPTAGSYLFTITVEGDVRLFVNGNALINATGGTTTGVQQFTANYNVAAAGATAFITLEMISYTGNAELNMSWALASGGAAPQPATNPQNPYSPPANNVPANPSQAQPPTTSNTTVGGVTNPYGNTTTAPQTTGNTGSIVENGVNPYLNPSAAVPAAPIPATTGTTLVTTFIPFGQAPTGGGQTWTVNYFNEGNPTAAASTNEPADGISRDYADLAPADGVNPDRWTSEWVRNVTFAEGTYTFYMRADDAATLSIDGAVVLNQEVMAEGLTLSADVYLGEGVHTITMTHFDAGANANLFLTWSPPIGTTLLPDGCNGETAGVNGSAPACPNQSANFTQTATTTTVPQMDVTVRAGPLFFRPAPTRRATAMRTISRGEQYIAIGRSGDNIWVQLIVDGVTGWSMTEFLTLAGDINTLAITDGSTPEPTTTLPADNTTITDESSQPEGIQGEALGSIRIRTEPTTASDRIGNVPWGEQATILERTSDNNWFLVNYNGVQGWSSAQWFTLINATLEDIPITNSE